MPLVFFISNVPCLSREEMLYNTKMYVERRMGISTITLARSTNEEKRITTALGILYKNLARSGRQIPIVAVDGGSDISFVKKVEGILGIDVPLASEKGLFPQVLASLQWAKDRGVNAILYTESDKVLFSERITNLLTPAEDLMHMHSNFGIILAARTPESFATYPETQRAEESTVNSLLRDITGLDFDFTYGPRIISADMIDHLKKLPKDIGWGWLSAAVVIAKKRGKGIYAVTMDFPCQVEDKFETESDRKYRQSQAQNHRYAIDLAEKL
ncbi:hypothetical protein HY612_03220 [Candidatus Roizmanbacteria bacterium]|nr:hypothetical protein [Candidatus Roizmanbacteria bacterium]